MREGKERGRRWIGMRGEVGDVVTKSHVKLQKTSTDGSENKMSKTNFRFLQTSYSQHPMGVLAHNLFAMVQPSV